MSFEPYGGNTAPYQSPDNTDIRPVSYSLSDSVFAWLSLLFGYCFCRVLPVSEHPFGGFLLVLCLFVTAFIFLKIRKVKISPLYLLSGISGVVVAGALVLTDSDMLIHLAFTYAIADYCYFLYAALGNSLESGFSDYIPLDFLKAIFAMPLCSVKALFGAISSNTSKAGGKLLVKILAGLLVAVIPTLLVLGFLSYDKDFMDLLEKITVTDFDLGSHLASLLFAIPMAMYGFGLYISSRDKRMQDKFTVESCKAAAQKAKIMPQLTAAFAVLPILFLYVVFFISQWQYYVSGFTGVLPENFSYAQYAREGFFQLCSVSVINLIVILAIALLMRRNKNGKSPLLKVLTVIFCLCTLILISTAVAKLVMYIDMYGLTQKRVYAMWLMAVIALVYIIIAIGQFLPRIRPAATSCALCVVLFAALALSNVNGHIAQYNVERYMDGSLQSVDVEALDDLGDSAVPAMVHLLQATDNAAGDPRYPESLRDELYDALMRRANRYQRGWVDESIFALDLPQYLAKQALESYGFCLEEQKEN